MKFNVFKKVLFYCFLLVIQLLLIGYLYPFMMSYSSDFIVGAGFCLLVINIVLYITLIVTKIINFLEKDKKNGIWYF